MQNYSPPAGMIPPQSQRRHPRFTPGDAECSGSLMSTGEVRILDVSLGGLSLMAERRLDIGKVYAVRLNSGHRTLSLRGAVVWSVLAEARKTPKGDLVPVYRAGMQFSGLSSDQAAELGRMIEHCRTAAAPHEQRHDVRFHIKRPHNALIRFPDHYKVSRISLSGMLIESAHDWELSGNLPMELTFPAEEPIRFFGRVASKSVTRGEDGSRYAFGIEFSDLSVKAQEALARFIGYCAAGASGGKKVKGGVTGG